MRFTLLLLFKKTLGWLKKCLRKSIRQGVRKVFSTFLTHADSHLEESPRGEGYRQDFLFVFLFLCWLILAYSNKLPFWSRLKYPHCRGRAHVPGLRWDGKFFLIGSLPERVTLFQWCFQVITGILVSSYFAFGLCLSLTRPLETIAKAGTLMIVTVSRHCFLSALCCLLLSALCFFPPPVAFRLLFRKGNRDRNRGT